jgi:hypothetical protein
VTKRLPGLAQIPLLVAALFDAACGGGQPAGLETIWGLTRVSGASPFSPGCNGEPQSGANYRNSAVEPFLSINPINPAHFIAVWQQDRWSNSGANGLLAGVSQDGGHSWTRTFAHFSRCTGGNQSNGGDYDRASDPWVTFSADGTAYQIGLAFNHSLQRSFKAILVSRSTDGGFSWSEPIALARDTEPDFILDKPAITADPRDAGLVYAVWDRLTEQTNPNEALATGPTWFARTVDGSWEAARAIYDPGRDAQTVSNQVVVLPDGTLINFFLWITKASSDAQERHLAILRSTDKGVTWSLPIVVAKSMPTRVLDSKSGHGVRSGSVVPTIAVDAVTVTGKVYVVWEDSRFSETSWQGIAFSKSTDGGLTWSSPKQINQSVNTHAFTPSIAVSRTGKLSVSYYDLREDNDSKSFLASYWVVSSADGGKTWEEKAIAEAFSLRTGLVDVFGSGGRKVGDDYFVGDYQGLAHSGDSPVPLFAAPSSRGTSSTDIFLRAIASP